MTSRPATVRTGLALLALAGSLLAAARVRPPMPKITGPVMFDTPEADAILSALQVFCRWAEDTHDVDLHTQFKDKLGALGSSLPRTIEANRRRTRATDRSQGELYEVLDVDAEGGRLRVGGRDGNAQDVTVDVDLAAWLHSGDRLRAHAHPDGRIAVYCCYPPESSALEAR